jgi:hypothetical protein
MNWNGLSDASIISVDQKLLLMVTPPVTATFTPLPPTITPTPLPTLTATLAAGAPIAADAPEPSLPGSNWWLALLIFIIVVGLGWVVWVLLSRKTL